MHADNEDDVEFLATEPDSKTSYTLPPKSGRGVHVYVLDSICVTYTLAQHTFAICRACSSNIGMVLRTSMTPGTLQVPVIMDMGLTVPVQWPGKGYGVAPKATIHGVALLSPLGYGNNAGIVYAIDWVLAKGAKPAVISEFRGDPGVVRTPGKLPLIKPLQEEVWWWQLQAMAIRTHANLHQDLCQAQ